MIHLGTLEVHFLSLQNFSKKATNCYLTSLFGTHNYQKVTNRGRSCLDPPPKNSHTTYEGEIYKINFLSK